MSLLQIYQWVCQWKNFENRLTFGEVMGKSVVSCFFETQSGARCRLAYGQLMPLPLTVSCFSEIQIGFTFLVLAHPGSPGKGPLNGCVCVLGSVFSDNVIFYGDSELNNHLLIFNTIWNADTKCCQQLISTVSHNIINSNGKQQWTKIAQNSTQTQLMQITEQVH